MLDACQKPDDEQNNSEVIILSSAQLPGRRMPMSSDAEMEF